MAKFTNTAPGARGVRMKDGTTTFIDAGATLDLDEGDIDHIHEDIAKGERAAEAAERAEGDPIEEARREVAEKAQAYIDRLQSEHADALTVATDRADKAEADLAEANEKIASLEADLAEATKPAELPGLTGKNKAELLSIAKAEGVDVAEDATNAQIVDAIEAKRAA